jgi:hypothetical protein
MFVDDTNPGPLFFDAAGAKPPSLGDFERFGSPRIGGWGAVRHLYHSLEYLVSVCLPAARPQNFSRFDSQVESQVDSQNPSRDFETGA